MVSYPLICWISVILLSAKVYGSSVYYCQNGKTQTTSGQTEGVVKTRETEGGFSANDLLCSWVIDAGEGSKIKLTIISLDLQWSPKYTTCSGYDNLQIKEGDAADGFYITSVCHAKNPYNIISRGSKLFLQMSTTQQDFDPHKGIELKFETFSNISCPPGWFQASDSPSECLMISNTQSKVKWEDSQDVCAFSLANLASITSQEQFQAVLDHGKNQSVDHAWIGLSDLVTQQTFRWVDKQPLEYERAITGYGYQTNCVAQEFSSGNWKALECDTALNYICKANKDGSTVIYPAIPIAAPPEEGGGGTKVFLIVIIVVVVISLAAVAVFYYICCYRRNKTCCRSSSRSRSPNRDSMRSAPECEPAVSPPSYAEALHLDDHQS